MGHYHGSHMVNDSTQITCSRCLVRGGSVTLTAELTMMRNAFKIKCKRYGHVTNGVPVFGCCEKLTTGALTYGDVKRK